MENKILEAFEAGKKIKHVKWANDEWIMKIGDNRTMSQYSESKPQIPLDKYPELWEIVQEDVEPEAQTNPILEAYEQGKRVKRKHWPVWHWIKKHSETQSITSHNSYHKPNIWCFDTKPETWEIHPEDTKPESPKDKVEHNCYGVKVEVSNFETPTQPKTSMFIGEIQQAIELLKENGYEIYQITKTKL